MMNFLRSVGSAVFTIIEGILGLVFLVISIAVILAYYAFIMVAFVALALIVIALCMIPVAIYFFFLFCLFGIFLPDIPAFAIAFGVWCATPFLISSWDQNH